MKRISRVFVLILAMAGLCFAAFEARADMNDSSVKVKWGYIGNNGPVRWGQLNPAFALCSKGQSQSPINIDKKFKKMDSDLEIHYQPAMMRIVDDGITQLLIKSTQTVINDGHGIQLNFPRNGARETIRFGGVDYHLEQFHMHSPSENTLNGQAFPMEIHFVHQGDDGKVAVIGVFVKAGKANPVLQNLIDHFPSDEGIEHSLQGVQINPVDLLPERRAFFYFSGSLTTPPCTEGLQWIVMPEPITASSAQILLFRNAAGGENARPVQPRHKRKIFYSEK
ncbi:Carbonic anhydrase [Aquicella siphonis]|uniref:Carbonic anhydrase n=1 Tax=Aquicella siphonis TaxID=254247 RepID=A0A5E4PJW1_9COXI|nr:carbonic anhydrase family protein [Aquicella siphonis]VVC76651.1 Carbonic anhydrase [Aquicella siphonis]